MALSRLLVNIGYIDGRIDRLPVRPSLMLYFERVHKYNVMKLDDSYPMSLQLAYEAAKRDALTHDGTILDFDSWTETVDAVEMEQEKVNPTPGERSNDTSQTSPSRQE